MHFIADTLRFDAGWVIELGFCYVVVLDNLAVGVFVLEAKGLLLKLFV